MKTTFLTSLLLTAVLALSAQPSGLSLRSQKTNKGDVYALIIGISDYEDPKIDDLSYAHKDAEIFAEFLQSKAGGNVPLDNITLLTEKNATISNIYDAKNAIEKKIKKDDRLYFYFSGHGDVESNLYKLGFLIAYDTPYGNYLNNAVRIADINNMANTLSVTKGVEVVLITDACHSGKLAGSDNRGRQLVGDQIAAVQAKEIRLASCEPDQLSEEDRAWGGGRGAFSYHLVNGLKGLADAGSKNGIITLGELDNYLRDIVPDEVFNLKEKDQFPVIEGKQRLKMAIVDKETLANLSTEQLTPTDVSNDGVSRSMGASVKLNFIRELSESSMESRADYSQLRTHTREELLTQLKSYFRPSEGHLSDQNYKEAIVSSIHNRVQKVINDYLRGSESELERRQYYSDDKDVYQRYIDMLAVALKLEDVDSQLFHILNVKYHYFDGLNSRLKLLFSSDFETTYAQALIQQNKAYQLDSMAPYVINELGVLKNIKKDDECKAYYERAIQLAPKWSIPRSNLSNYYYKQKEYTKGIDYGREAIFLNDNLFTAYINMGNNFQEQGNLLLAEENFMKAEFHNNRHFRSAKKLGQLYAQLLDYPSSEYYFIEAQARLEGLSKKVITAIEDSDNDGTIRLLDSETTESSAPCKINMDKIADQDVMAYFILGLQSLEQPDWTITKNYYEKALGNNPQDPIIYKYLGDLYRSQGLILESEYCYQKAVEYYLDFENFNQNAEDLKKKQAYLDCDVYDKYKEQYFNKHLLFYLLADSHEKLGNLAAAEELYTNAPLADRYESLRLLTSLYESQKRFKEAEKTINKYSKFGKSIYQNELIAFYNRRVSKDENATYYRYSRALLKYDMAIEKVLNEDGIEFLEDKLPTHVPGTGELLGLSLSIEDISHSAILDLEYLNESNNQDSIFMSDLQYKLAKLYQYNGELEKSQQYFEKANESNPANSSSALALIPLATRAYDYELALNTLDHLYDKGQLNQALLNQYANFNMKARRTDRSEEIIKQLRSFEIENNNSLLLTELLNNILAKKYTISLKQLRKIRGKGVLGDADISYTEAVIHAKLQDKESCYAKLTQAVREGFSFRNVISNEEAFKQYESDDAYFDIVDIIFQ